MLSTQSTLSWYATDCKSIAFTNIICVQFAEFKRLERDHAKEKQKLVKDKDAGMFDCSPSSRMTTKTSTSFSERTTDEIESN